ncbi:MAG: DUF4198 domain-containing protein [Desulfotignum sp.]
MKKQIIVLVSLVSLILSSQAFAHFQLIHTPDAALEGGGKIPLALVFTHPFDAGHTMDMGTPEQFFVLQSRGENPVKKKDLMDTLVPISWQSLTNSGKAFKTTYTARGGDHIFCLVPDPYFEAEEDSYIQQMTKVIINVGGIPGEWMEPAVEAPQSAFEMQTIFADDNGIFTFGIPRAGWWGFAALDLDGEATHKGKPCSKDAVIWIKAVDM